MHENSSACYVNETPKHLPIAENYEIATEFKFTIQ